MRLLVWLVRAFVFFTLFAFALNNQQVVGVHWFFGHQWQAPMVFVVLGAFAQWAAPSVCSRWCRVGGNTGVSPSRAPTPPAPAPVTPTRTATLASHRCPARPGSPTARWTLTCSGC